MLEETLAHPELNEILSKEGNTKCFDCGEDNPKWASLNNGIILCLKCAGIHRSFGLQISIIRSVQVDSWTEKQIKYLSLGGNSRFKAFLLEYKIEPSSSFELKYKSKAAEYYRYLLKNEVETFFDDKYKFTEMEKPDLEKGIEIIEIKQNDKEIDNNFYIGSDNQNQKQNDNSFLGAFGTFLKDFASYAKTAVDNVSKNINEVKIADTVINAGNAMLTFAKNSGVFIANSAKEVANSEIVQNLTKNAESGINSIVEKSKIILNLDQQEINPNSQQNPAIDVFNNSINLANNQLNPTNTVENNINPENNINNKNENINNINMMVEKEKNNGNKIEEEKEE